MGTEALQAVSKCPHCSAESATGKKFCADYPESVQLQWHVYTQPRNSYAVIKNVVNFFWGDPADNLKQHPLLVNYVADTSSHEQAFKELHVDKDVVFADGFPFGNVR